jgi:hypothetical protein
MEELHGHVEGLIGLTGNECGHLANALHKGGKSADRDVLNKLIFGRGNIYVSCSDIQIVFKNQAIKSWSNWQTKFIYLCWLRMAFVIPNQPNDNLRTCLLASESSTASTPQDVCFLTTHNGISEAQKRCSEPLLTRPMPYPTRPSCRRVSISRLRNWDTNFLVILCRMARLSIRF